MSIGPDDILASIVIGIGATLLMDLWNLFLWRAFSIPSLNLCLLGRWLRHMPQGTLRHASIGGASPKSFECTVGWGAHYTIGVVFALAFVVLSSGQWLARPTLLPALLYGVATVVFPFFVMQPSFGLGIAASKTPKPMQARLKSLMTHSVFGIGLYLAAVACARDSRPSSGDNKKDSLAIVAPHVDSAVPIRAGGSGPPLPYIARNACPGEGCELGNWIACRDLTAHREPALTSPPVMQLHRGDKFVADAAEVIIARPGVVVFSDTVRIGASDGPLTPQNSTLMTPRDTMYLLDYIGEGYSHAWIKGEAKKVFLMNVQSRGAAAGPTHSVTAPVSTWWVKAAAARVSGWIPIKGGDVAGSSPHYEDNPPRCPGPSGT